MHSPPARSRTNVIDPSPVQNSKAVSRWGKHLGAAAFLFFLIKGLAWLIVPAAITYFAAR